MASETFTEQTEGDPKANSESMAGHLVEALAAERQRARARAAQLADPLSLEDR